MNNSEENDQKQLAKTNVKGLAKSYLCKMKGGKCPAMNKSSFTGLLVTSIGSFMGIGLITLLATYYKLPLLLPSFGASAVLLYGACHVPMAQPRNVIGGHIISALTGVTTYQLFGNPWWAITLAVTVSIVMMTVTHTLHPPGGATAFVAVYSSQNYSFVFSPVGIGVTCLVLIAVAVNNISSQRKYPDYWY
ncbi:HPP family protein [Desulfofarcimen acetoxidans DSM 771]|jgi:CBS-domain-containing membrane protein|uniref:HPP family protein n=1 Tax=Desulfofarcimen acetoxidans (strain ATCC 49208 / DSM 771 / KCTC 5769 / VKM B-1644 / 5575) TaxID=485916 RepID=C8VXA3_DESAS|nr:HPP family protein [Desulfofarcimen acetoxidans]ACV64499.1 HPP family protein [Desulfofarcimen acetoxidans DSM 771]